MRGPWGRLAAFAALLVAVVWVILRVKTELSPIAMARQPVTWFIVSLVLLVLGLLVARRLEIVHRRWVVGAVAFFVFWHGWVGPWGHELSEIAHEFPVPAGGSIVYEYEFDGIPYCMYECPSSQVTYGYDGVDDRLNWTSEVRRQIKAEAADQGWSLLSELTTIEGKIEPCSVTCHMNFVQPGLFGLIEIERGASEFEGGMVVSVSIEADS